MATKRSHKVPSHFFPKDHKASLEEFRDLCSQQVTTEHRCPMASAVTSNIPTYDLPSRFLTPESLNTLQDEWNLILLSGPGVFVVKKLYKDLGLIDRVNEIYTSLIASEKVGSSGRSGDYFSSAGLNSRIWNSLFKHCAADSESFAQYYSNPWLAAICEAWLGAMYRITAQVNIVHPGGKPQGAHRDYHLRFLSDEVIRAFPKGVQVAS